jgi:peptidoglycan hydrolase CwlO-like protein
MSTDFKQISRKAITAIGATSMLVSSLAITAPTVAQAADTSQPGTLAEANAQIDGTISSMNQQASSLQGQIGATDTQIAQLETEQNELKTKLEEKKGLLKQTLRDAYVAGDPSSVEVLASNQSFSGVVGQQHYRDQVSSKTGKAAKEVRETQKQIDQKVADAKKKRDGLTAMKGQLDSKIAAAQAQEQAKAALAEQTLGQEKLYQEMKKQQAAQTITAAVPAPRNSGGGSGYVAGGGGCGIPGLNGCLGYAKPGGNCVNEPGVNNPHFGNPIDWPVTSGSPSIGATALWTFNHTGVVTGIWSDGWIEVRHQNWSGGNQHTFPPSAFRGFR